jgi:hypothetical protein
MRRISLGSNSKQGPQLHHVILKVLRAGPHECFAKINEKHIALRNNNVVTLDVPVRNPQFVDFF